MSIRVLRLLVFKVAGVGLKGILDLRTTSTYIFVNTKGEHKDRRSNKGPRKLELNLLYATKNESSIKNQES